MSKITGQVIYCGPTILALGLQYGTIYRNGVHPQLQTSFDECPALAELFVPVSSYAAIRRELNFDIARNMRGTNGKHVTFYHSVQTWLAGKNASSKATSTGVKQKV